MGNPFPKMSTNFLNSKSFHDQELTLTFKDWAKKGNEDRPARGKYPASTWQQNIAKGFILRYSFPEFAIDPITGEKRLREDGSPWRNSNYDPDYPHGYSIVYQFEEGVFESCSFPLFKAFCMIQPVAGDRLVIGQTGEGKDSKWRVKKVNKDHTVSAHSDKDIPDIDFSKPEYSADPEPEEPPF